MLVLELVEMEGCHRDATIMKAKGAWLPVAFVVIV